MKGFMRDFFKKYKRIPDLQRWDTIVKVGREEYSYNDIVALINDWESKGEELKLVMKRLKVLGFI